MNIKPISGFTDISPKKNNKQTEKPDPDIKTDKLNISDQARIMNNSSKIDKLDKIGSKKANSGRLLLQLHYKRFNNRRGQL